MDHTYWQRQEPTKPLFPDIEWSKPEQRSQRGRLGIIGGNKLGFAGVAESYSVALHAGAGEVRALLPDALKKSIPTSMTDVIFAPSTTIGSLSREGIADLIALGNYSNGILLAGDCGRNSETAITYEDFLREWEGQVTITRDAFDLIKHSADFLVNRPQTTLVVSFAQLQKLFQALYYPKILTFSMQLMQFVEAMHKFTITYPVMIAVLHKDTMVISHGGQVVTMPWDSPMRIWRGETAAQIATYIMWTPSKPLAAAVTSIAFS